MKESRSGVVRRVMAGRGKWWVAGATVAAVVAATTVVVGLQAGQGFHCADPVADSATDALIGAAHCGIEIEVLEERSPWESTYALPDGKFRSEISAMPSQVLVDGEWAELDTSITSPDSNDHSNDSSPDAAGSVAPLVSPWLMSRTGVAAEPVPEPDRGTLQVAAPVFPIELNAGGTAGVGEPLASITRDGHRFEVWFPAPLPVGKVSGSRVVYDLADGVRLVVQVAVDGTGVLPVVELSDPEAAERFRSLVDAARPEGSPADSGELVFQTKVSDGLRLEAGTENNVAVLDEVGEEQFLSAPPVMWDSAGGEAEELPATVTEVGATDRTVSPAPGDVVAQMPARVDGQSIVVAPDAGMLESADTVWPVYIDPAFSGHGPAEWVAVRSGGYTGTLYKWATSGGEGTGYCTDLATCNTVFRQRLSWEFTGWSTIRNLERDNIVSAGFTVNGIHSASCTATTTDLVMTNSVTSSTTWSTIGDWSAYISSRTEAHSATCLGRGDRTWDATEALRRYAERDSPTVTMGLKPRDESTMTSWKRFGHDATVSVVYNRPPDKPTGMDYDSEPDAVCTTGGTRPFINDATPTLSAIMSDADPGDSIKAVFAVAETGTSNVPWQSPTLAGVTDNQRKAVTVGTSLVDDTYSWHVTATDGRLWSGWGDWCEFTLDTVRPNKVPTVTAVTDTTQGIETVYTSGAERGGAKQTGKFTFTSGVSDAVKFEYTFTGPSITGGTKTGTLNVALGASGTISFTPDAGGATTLSVKSIDRAGNKSDPATYTFEVASPLEDAIWKLDEGTGTSSANTGPKDVGPVKVSGATWVPGPHELFGSRPGDWALKFDGIDDQATSSGPVVDMTKSFVVSAHVQLDPAMVTNNKYGTVLAQDGLTYSGFRLRYQPTNTACLDKKGAQMDGCWEFLVTGTSSSYARSTVPVKAGEWVHLVGEYDVKAPAVRVWVCEAGTPTAPTPGEPVRAEAPRGAIPVDAGGVFTLGRAWHGGAAADRFQGAIDNVRVFSGQIADSAKLRRLCQGAEATDYGTGATGLNALDPTVTEQ